MPVRSLTSSVLTWPDRSIVEGALRQWAEAERKRRTDLVAVGYFGSYARGDWGPGSDLDVVLVAESDEPFERRTAGWDVTGLPVPADVLPYTPDEWQAMLRRGDRFGRMLAREVMWVLDTRREVAE